MNTNIKEVIFLLANETAFSSLIFIWYILYRLKFIKTSPLFALLITLIQNIIVIIILIKKNKITKMNIIRFSFILFILKILPLIYFFPNYLNFGLKDVIIVIYLYLIYITIIIILIEIFDIKLNLENIIYNDTIGDSYEKTATTRIYDFTYKEIIERIFN